MSDGDTKKPSAEISEKNDVSIQIRPRTSSSSSSLTLRTPRSARFVEATSVNSPVGPPTSSSRSPFAGLPIITTTHAVPQPQVSDVGFGYMSSNELKHTSVEVPLTPRSPMKSALKPPGTPGRFIDPRSPTFKEEVKLEKEELKTEKQNAADLKVKKRVRVAKFFLRGVNFSCSLIILAMISVTMTIFNATRALPSRSGSPSWAPGQQTWPQITLLCIASVSLAACIFIFYSYWKGGHRKAEKTAIYYTTFAIGFFVLTTVMWIVAAVVMHTSKANGNNQDMWGWSCNSASKRATLFEDDVNYTLLCRLQNWALICIIIEIVVEVITITIYGIVFYRFWSKRKLHKSMNVRDKARSDLYLAQLRSQSAPNTPGLKTSTSPVFPPHLHDDIDAAEKGQQRESVTKEDLEYARRHERFIQQPQPFALQPPPAPKGAHVTTTETESDAATIEEKKETVNDHVPAAPGEQQYAAVPIPGSYASPIASPAFQPQGMHFPGQQQR